MKLLLVDLDGTVRQTADGEEFINRPDNQKLIPGAIEALNSDKYTDYVKVGITNQGGVAAGFKSLGDAIEEQIFTLKLLQPELDRSKGWFKGIIFCPDSGNTAYYIKNSLVNNGNLAQMVDIVQYKSNKEKFRKPNIGMVKIAFDQLLAYNITDALMVGDMDFDQQCADNANIKFMWAKDWWMY